VPERLTGTVPPVNGYTIAVINCRRRRVTRSRTGNSKKLRIIDATANTYIDVALINSTGHLQPLTVVGRDRRTDQSDV